MTPRSASLLPALAVLAGLLAAAPAATQPNVVGSWSPVYSWPNVAIHLHLLPDGRILSYADDDHPNYNTNGTRLAGSTRTFLTDLPSMGAPGATIEIANDRTNMFCSGHAHLADGRLFVVGGHDGQDGRGELRTQFFDYRDPTAWFAGPDMFQARWYPSACVLSNGDLLAISGSQTPGVNASVPEVWSAAGGWRQLTDAVRSLSLYPFTFLAPDGRVFVAGPQRDCRYLNTTGLGSWQFVANHILNVNRSYGSAAQFGDGQILVAGGGDPPTSTCEIIDLGSGAPAWQGTDAMAVARRQHNLTILPDGNVLVTGGSSSAGFNNNAGALLTTELWTPPPVGTWAQMANATRARLYHSTALLLPDGRVLSTGSGRPKASNGGVDQYNAEIYSPPYLFLGPRPTITGTQQMAINGTPLTIDTPDAAAIAQVTLLRLGSSTHSFNQGQRISRLVFTSGPGTIAATIPSPDLCPPGFYMLFIINGAGVPSIARMILVSAPGGTLGADDPPDQQLLDFVRLASANPARAQVRIAFQVSRSEEGRVEVLDVTGRRVKVVAEGLMMAGRETVVTWDGTDERGQGMPSGLYWYRLQTPSVTRSGKLALLGR